MEYGTPEERMSGSFTWKDKSEDECNPPMQMRKSNLEFYLERFFDTTEMISR